MPITLAALGGPAHRLVSERRGLSAATGRVTVVPSFPLPQLRRAREALRQRARARLAPAEGSLSQLRRADLSSLSGGRGTDGCARRGGCPDQALGARHHSRAGAGRGAGPDRADRPRSADHPDQDHASGGARRDRDRARDRPGRRARAAVSGAAAAASCSCSCSRTRAGWGWATSSSPVCSACS